MDDGPRRAVVTGMGIASEAEDVGAIVASSGGGLTIFERRSRVIFEHGPQRRSPLLATMMIPHMAAAHVSLELGIKGPLGAVCTSCPAGVVPPTINLTDPDQECDLDYVPGTARVLPVRTAMSNSLGFGGHDISLIFRRFSGGVPA
jgi:3-oxoacyl-(acyl-carrier-protein) synthase